MWWKLTILFYIFINNYNYVNGNLEVLQQCCVIGETWASEEKGCSQFSGQLENIPIEFRSICFSTIGLCCSQYHRYDQCEKGKAEAKTTQECNQKLENYHSEAFTDCCESCKIGLIIGSSSDKCELYPFEFEPLSNTAYEECCKGLTQDSKSGESFVVTNDTEFCSLLSGKALCEHICIDIPNSYVCDCEKGYVLMDDRISCQKIDDNLNEIGEGEPKIDEFKEAVTECQKGYLKDDNGICLDIDECDTGDASCDITSEACINQPGAYMCIPLALKYPECQDGYRFNTKKETCEDINECLEDTHSCNKKTQICMNTKGGYSCQIIAIETCFTGLVYDRVSKSCKDIDECANKTICEYGLTCVNTLGSFQCVGDPILSLPKQPTSPSSPNVLPIPIDRQKMSCAPGYTKMKDKCVDIDECMVDKNSCDSYQNCVNRPGGFECECKPGFVLDSLQNACVDVNECQVNIHDCLGSQRCDNTIGSYNCIRLQSCGTGYTLNAATGKCEDDDECSLGRHNCEAPYECRNTQGSFRCHYVRYTTSQYTTQRTTTSTSTQPTTLLFRTTRYQRPQPPPRPTPRYESPTSNYRNNDRERNDRNEEYNRLYGQCKNGFERNVQGACVDTNECEQLGRNPCPRNQRCVNTNGSYRCEILIQCSGGYMSNPEGTQCIDIDECETRKANCGPDQLCRNKPGGYVCYCPPGHTVRNGHCEDIDECRDFRDQVCPINAECTNTVGSYRCECKEGFRKLQEIDKTCVDVNECTEIPGLCEQKCINYWGSYRCACDSGYKISENNRTCNDLDECEIHKSYNLCMGICENVPGSYRCACPPGYRIGTDGRSCQDIDECETQNVCRGRNEICTNTRGNYRCSRIDCPPEYMLDTEKRNRCKRISMLCDVDDVECFRKPTAYSYNFITIVSNMSIPPKGRGLFNFKGPNYFENIDFDYRIVDVQARSNVRKATDQWFEMHKMNNEVLLSLMRTLEGPQEIELELSMTVYRNGQPSGTNIAKIFIIVSEYEF